MFRISRNKDSISLLGQFRTVLRRQLVILLLLIPVTSYYLIHTTEGINKFAIVSDFPQTSIEVFKDSLSNLVHQSQHLTKSYHDEIGKWRMHQYDNYTLAHITDTFIPKFENLTNIARIMTYPEDYKYVHEALVNSLSFETDSYKHFREYLLSGNITEDEISNKFFSRAFEYEQIYSEFLSTTPPIPVENITKFISLD
ncbi:hypothetical protein BH18THE1_BH18THE1_06170 [soil metagenome]